MCGLLFSDKHLHLEKILFPIWWGERLFNHSDSFDKILLFQFLSLFFFLLFGFVHYPDFYVYESITPQEAVTYFNHEISWCALPVRPPSS